MEVDHLTAETPTASDAVPLTRIEPAVVDTIEPPGEAIEIVGGAGSGLAGLGGGAGAGAGGCGAGGGVGAGWVSVFARSP